MMSMTNLFSSFDPASSNTFSLNWISTIIPLLFLPLNFWNLNNRVTYYKTSMLKLVNKEFKTLLTPAYSQGTTLFIMSLLWFIMINNIMGLFPYIFTATSHLSIPLAMALSLWVAFMMFGWTKNTKKMFAHLLPTGTPPPLLMNFMIMIETISNMIRPITLSIRLSANMIAGHLLMTLLGNQASPMNITNSMMVINTQFFLISLELAVALIQAYVFTILISLYSSEIH